MNSPRINEPQLSVMSPNWDPKRPHAPRATGSRTRRGTAHLVSGGKLRFMGQRVRPSREAMTVNRAAIERLRRAYRPDRVEVLLIGESPPDPNEGELRFFYAPELAVDNLYRAVVQAVYQLDADTIRNTPKAELLGRLRDDGFWLIDAVEEPINHWSRPERRRAIREGVPQLVERCRAIAPGRGVVICHGEVYSHAADAMRAAGVRVLHDERIPFPWGNWRRQFVDGLRAALAR